MNNEENFTLEQVKTILTKKGMPSDLENIVHVDEFIKGFQLFQNKKYEEAIEIFSLLLHYQPNDLAHLYLGGCYYRLDNLKASYNHLSCLIENTLTQIRNTALSLLSAIDIQWGNYDKAIDTLKTLPITPVNQINLCLAYWKKYRINKKPQLLEHILKLLNNIDIINVPKPLICTYYHLKGLIYQVRNDFLTSQTYYEKAFEYISSPIDPTELIQDYASLQIKNEQYEDALNLITKLRNLPSGSQNIEKLYISKLQDKGLLLFKQKHYEEAIEVYLKILGIQNNPVARKYLGLCYFQSNHFDSAYKHFTYLSKQIDEEIHNFAISMLVAIDIICKNYAEAIYFLKKLPQTTWTNITQSYLYWKKYKIDKNESLLRDALKLLDKLNYDIIEIRYYSNHLKGLIHQTLQNFKIAETHYTLALQDTQQVLEKANLLNDYASLLIESSRYDEAELILNKACVLIAEEKCLEKSYNDKWFGVLYFQKKDYSRSKEYLEKAAIVIKEKSLIEEIAIVNFLLVNTYKLNDFYKAADYYADGVVFERLAEKIDERDDKLLQFYFNNIVKL